MFTEFKCNNLSFFCINYSASNDIKGTSIKLYLKKFTCTYSDCFLTKTEEEESDNCSRVDEWFGQTYHLSGCERERCKIYNHCVLLTMSNQAHIFSTQNDVKLPTDHR